MGRIAYIAPQIGALSATFVYRDIAGLRAQRMDLMLFSVRQPADKVISEEARAFMDETTYLYAQGPLAIAGAMMSQAARNRGRFFATFGIALRDALFAATPRPGDKLKFLWQFGAACLFAEKLRGANVQHIHANFAHIPTTIAMYAAGLTGLRYSFMCHAHDVFVNGAALKEKTARAAFGACISEYNVRYLAERGCDTSKLVVVRVGLDLAEFPLLPERGYHEPPRILSVAALREKKGHRYLVDACKVLSDRGVPFACTIVGGGPLHDALAEQVRRLGLEDVVTLAGAQPQEKVKQYFRDADVITLPCVVAKNNDMDGIPVVLMEAMAMGIPVVTTAVSGNPELVIDGETGLIVPPEDSVALADALERLLRDEGLARRLRPAARARVESEFDQEKNSARLKAQLEAAITQAGVKTN